LPHGSDVFTTITTKDIEIYLEENVTSAENIRELDSLNKIL